MTHTNPTSQFFTVGGALPLDAVYVVRPADEQLLRATLGCKYCNVLAPYQMGQSSLSVRSADRLGKEGVRTAVIDLTDIGTELGADEWYLGLLTRLKEQLGLAVDERAWWDGHAQQGMAQRFSDFLRDVLLEEIAAPVVIFIDEIDSTLSLPFTDDFFAAIHAAHNARASDPAYQRLTFVLLGAVRLADLIKDRSRTPYNIGLSIDLDDFSPQEAKTLLPGLEAVSAEQAETILERVLHWTGGHPYLTQKLCAEIVAADDGRRWDDEMIDQLVGRLFLSEEAREDTNLQYVRDCILKSRARERLLRKRAGWLRRVVLNLQEIRDREKLLRVYRQVLSGKSVADDELDPVKSQLKLSGLLKVTPQVTLAVRNRIYAAAFNQRWIRERWRPVIRMRMAVGAGALSAILLLMLLVRQLRLAPSGYLEGDCSFEQKSPLKWAYGGELPVTLVPLATHGSRAALLGEPTPQAEQGQGTSWLTRTLQVPPGGGRPMLTFKYRMCVNDILAYSDFSVWLIETNGALPVEIKQDGFRPCEFDANGHAFAPPGGYDVRWRTAKYDLSDYKGKTVQLMFVNSNQWSKSLGIWTYLDYACVEDAGLLPDPPGPYYVYLPLIINGYTCDPVKDDYAICDPAGGMKILSKEGPEGGTPTPRPTRGATPMPP